MSYFYLGVGIVKVLTSILLAAYYPIIMALSLFYGTRSIIGSIPFPECSNSINFFVSLLVQYYLPIYLYYVPYAMLNCVVH